jgi:hypothetical protein
MGEKAGYTKNQINGKRGSSLSENLFIPKEARGQGKTTWLKGKEVPYGTKDSTVPDYRQTHDGKTEWVNLKSDLIDGKRAEDLNNKGVNKLGKAAADKYLEQAKKDVANLPRGDTCSLDFIRTPSAKTEAEMLRILFAEGSPISRVRFGDGEWHVNPN